MTTRKPSAGKLEPLCARTLRWAARRMRLYARGNRECKEEAQSRQGPNRKDEVALYDSKMWAYNIAASHLLSTAKAIEAKAITKQSRPRKGER